MTSAIDDAAAAITDRARLVPDFPAPGVLFRDLTPVLGHGPSLAAIGQALAELGGSADLVAGLEARGFLFGTATALAAGAGVLPLRKPGKLPGSGTDAVLSQAYALEYGSAALEVQPDDVPAGARVLIVDDVLATGGTAAAAVDLIRRAGGTVVGIAVAMELAGLGGRSRIDPAVPVRAIVTVQ